MKKLFVFLILIIIQANTILAQPSVQWAKDIGTLNHEYATQICTDDAGNIYVAGAYSDNLILCNDTLPDVIKPSTGNGTLNLFISKFDSSGQCMWTKTGISVVPTISGAIGTQIYDLKYYAGNLYCAGNFTDTLIFDNDTLSNYSCTNYCSTAFILNLDTSGTIGWSKVFLGSTSYSRIHTIIACNSGIFAVGGYQGILGVDTIQLTALQSWAYNGYLLKFDLSGKCVWGKNTGTSASSEIFDMDYDNDKYLYLTGDFVSALTFSSISIYDTLPPFSQRSTFLAKYDTSGNLIWAKGGPLKFKGMFYNQNVRYDNAGNIYFIASFADSATVSLHTFNTNSSAWYKDLIVKYDTSGQYLYGISASNRYGLQNYGSVITTSSSGLLYCASFMGTAIIGGDTIQANGASTDILLAEIGNNGIINWHRQYGGINSELPYEIYSNNNTIYLCGWTGSNYTMDTVSIINKGYGDILIAKINYPAVINSLSEINIKSEPEITIFPNPSNNFVTVNCNKIIDELTVTNIMGQCVYRTSFYKKEIRFQISANGIYTVAVTSGNIITTGKLIVMK